VTSAGPGRPVCPVFGVPGRHDQVLASTSEDPEETIMSFTQIIELVGVSDEQALRDHVARWDAHEAGGAPGYLGARVLADHDVPGRYLAVVDFSSREEAERNSDRAETAAWAEDLRELSGAASVYHNLRDVYATQR
jgi:hypothetical protein